jgi:hypothetical protein
MRPGESRGVFNRDYTLAFIIWLAGIWLLVEAFDWAKSLVLRGSISEGVEIVLTLIFIIVGFAWSVALHWIKDIVQFFYDETAKDAEEKDAD